MPGRSGPPSRGDWLFVIGDRVAMIAVIAMPIVVLWFLVRWVRTVGRLICTGSCRASSSSRPRTAAACARSRCCRPAPVRARAAAASRGGRAARRGVRFVSGLYFRGKLAYARRFAQPSRSSGRADCGGGVLVITPNAGLRERRHAVTRASRCARSRGRRSTSTTRVSPSARASARRAGARDRAGVRRRAARQHRVAEVRRRAAATSSASG